MGAGEAAQLSKARVALEGDTHSSPITHLVAYNSVPGDLAPSPGPHRHQAHMHCTIIPPVRHCYQAILQRRKLRRREGSTDFKEVLHSHLDSQEHCLQPPNPSTAAVLPPTPSFPT